MIKTITQPTFIVDTEVEKSTSWPTNSFVWVKATNTLYTLKDGNFINVSAAINYGYLDTTKKTGVFATVLSVNTTSGVGTFFPTDTGIVGGVALYSEVFATFASVNDASNDWSFSYTVSSDLKTVTVAAKRISFTNTSILGISVLATNTTVNIPNGIVMKLFIFGK